MELYDIISTVTEDPEGDVVENNQGLFYEDEYRMVTVCTSPTHNCQFYTIGGIEEFINEEDDNELFLLLQKARKVSFGKSMFMIDINQNYKDDIYRIIIDNLSKVKDTTLDSEIVMQSDYISTNNSERCIMLIKSQIFK